MADETKEYEVGHGKPPKATQFKKGQSGNPKGRPKSSKNVGSMLEEVFFRKIPITENGSRLEVTMLEAILRQLVNGAVKGEMRSIDRVLKLLPAVQEARAAELAGGEGATENDTGSDLAALEVLAGMFGSNPDQLFASIQGGIDDECPEF